MADSSPSVESGIWVIFLTMVLPSIGGLGYLTWLVYEYIRQHYVVSFNINTTQPCYEWIVLWLKKYAYAQPAVEVWIRMAFHMFR